MSGLTFAAVRVGSSGDGDLDLPRAVLARTSLVDIDGGDPDRSNVTRRRYRGYHDRHDCIGPGDWAELTINTFKGSSSILPADAGLVEAYGVQRYYTPEGRVSLTSRRLAFVLADCGMADVDLLKIDTEGMDWSIARDFFHDQCAAARALPPSVTLRSPAFRALVAPHRDVELRFTLAYDSWCGTVGEDDLVGGMRMRQPPPLSNVPCQGLFQPAVLPGGQFRLCPCRSNGSEYDQLVVGSDWDELPQRMLEMCGEFYAGRMPRACRWCGMYRPVTGRWLWEGG